MGARDQRHNINAMNSANRATMPDSPPPPDDPWKTYTFPPLPLPGAPIRPMDPTLDIATLSPKVLGDDPSGFEKMVTGFLDHSLPICVYT